MAQLDFSQMATAQVATDTTTTKTNYFSLKNDGEKAIVRFMHDSIDSFDVVSLHALTTSDGKWPKVNCLRSTAYVPLDACPICASGDNPRKKIFIHMIKYTTDERGNIVAEPCVWERSLKYAYELRDKLDTYGPLSNNLFIVTRHGKSGDLQTTYSIDYAVPTVYPTEKYPVVEGAFNGYTALGNAVWDKTFDELKLFTQTGSFNANASTISNSYSAPSSAYGSSAVESTVMPTYSTATNTRAPWDDFDTPVQKPVRSY